MFDGLANGDVGPKTRDGNGRRCSGSLREQYPVFFAWGVGPLKFLSHEESKTASLDDRIRSVWPFLVLATLRFCESLRPRERANYDPEDVLIEIYLKLAQRDVAWKYNRGKYLSFAAKVMDNELHRIREKTRTVRSPGNSYCRLREYEAEEQDETITAQRRSTLQSLRRSLNETEAIEGQDFADDDESDAQMIRREELATVQDAVIKAVMDLDPIEADAIGREFGLWGQPEQTVSQIAASKAHTRKVVRDAQVQARVKMKLRLEGMRHPAASPDGP